MNTLRIQQFITFTTMSSRERLIDSSMNTKKGMDVDAILAHVGDFDRYQYILLFIFSIINVISGFHYFGQTFINLIPNEQCIISENANVTHLYNNTNCSYIMHGYISIADELHWTGDQSWIPALGQSMFFVGAIVGSLILGNLADKIGRLHILVVANMLAFIGNLLTLFATESVFYTFSRFIAGLATDSNFVMMYIIVMEYLRPSMRTTGINLTIGIFYCLACVAVPWLAIYMHTWKRFLAVVAIPHLFVLSCYFIVPESAQWLLSKGRTDEAVKCFEKIAIINRREMNKDVVKDFKDYANKHINTNRNSSNFLGLFKTPKLRRKICILILKSMIITLCYDAIARNINNLNYSPFLLFSLTSITILPSCVIILLLQDRIGRKCMASGSLLLSGTFTLVVAYILAAYDNIDTTMTITIMAVARFGINIAYNSSAQYAVELIPTEVRGQGVSLIHVAGYAASFFSSQLLYTSVYWKPLPDVVIGILLLIGAAACLALPETLNKTLPVTLQDGEVFGENEKCFDFYCCSRMEDLHDIEP